MLRQQKIYEVVYQIGLAPFAEGNGLPLWEFLADGREATEYTLDNFY